MNRIPTDNMESLPPCTVFDCCAKGPHTHSADHDAAPDVGPYVLPRAEVEFSYTVYVDGSAVAKLRDYDIARTFADEIGGEVDA